MSAEPPAPRDEDIPEPTAWLTTQLQTPPLLKLDRAAILARAHAQAEEWRRLDEIPEPTAWLTEQLRTSPRLKLNKAAITARAHAQADEWRRLDEIPEPTAWLTTQLQTPPRPKLDKAAITARARAQADEWRRLDEIPEPTAWLTTQLQTPPRPKLDKAAITARARAQAEEQRRLEAEKQAPVSVAAVPEPVPEASTRVPADPGPQNNVVAFRKRSRALMAATGLLAAAAAAVLVWNNQGPGNTGNGGDSSSVQETCPGFPLPAAPDPPADPIDHTAITYTRQEGMLKIEGAIDDISRDLEKYPASPFRTEREARLVHLSFCRTLGAYRGPRQARAFLEKVPTGFWADAVRADLAHPPSMRLRR